MKKLEAKVTEGHPYFSHIVKNDELIRKLDVINRTLHQEMLPKRKEAKRASDLIAVHMVYLTLFVEVNQFLLHPDASNNSSKRKVLAMREKAIAYIEKQMMETVNWIQEHRKPS